MRYRNAAVIPAYAGIHPFGVRMLGERSGVFQQWIPAPVSSTGRRFAGMTIALKMLPVVAVFASALAVAQPGEPTAQRQQTLVRMVRQDCGSCHGMRLTGGLGPALTREALAERPLAALVATTLHGRPGTPMPGWHTMLSESDALWIAQQLQAGFPAESAGAK